VFSLFLWGAKPELLLLETYADHNVSGWLMSEKLDGVRAY
jgi:DNA ligase-1